VPVPEQEHPAAKAGRLVRAAGLALQRGLEKRTPPPSPPRVAPPPPPPPPVPTAGIVGQLVFATFLLSLVAFLLVVLHVEMALGGRTRTIFRLALGGVMLLEAALLTSNGLRANERLAQRLANRTWGPRGAINRRERFLARFARDALTLVGIAFLAAGAFELLEATVGY
jgi:hypothetical protein